MIRWTVGCFLILLGFTIHVASCRALDRAVAKLSDQDFLAAYRGGRSPASEPTAAMWFGILVIVAGVLACTMPPNTRTKESSMNDQSQDKSARSWPSNTPVKELWVIILSGLIALGMVCSLASASPAATGLGMLVGVCAVCLLRIATVITRRDHAEAIAARVSGIEHLLRGVHALPHERKEPAHRKASVLDAIADSDMADRPDAAKDKPGKGASSS